MEPIQSDCTRVTTSTVFDLTDILHSHAVVTIGTFDGVHIGHQALLSGAVARARALGETALVVTFEPIPASVLRPEHFLGRICPLADKLSLIEALGPDQILVLQFDQALARLAPDEFMSRIAQATAHEGTLGG